MRWLSSVALVAILMVVGCLTVYGAAIGADAKLHFDLPAQPMDRALRDFALQAGCNISFEPTLVVGLQAPVVKGEYPRNVALSMLLAGTPLRAMTVNGNTFQVVADHGGTDPDKKAAERRDLEEIVVTGTHIRGIYGASPVMEIGREEIDRSGYASLSDLMLSVPQDFGGGINAGTIVNNSQVNGRYADNPTGASVPNLRGLGPGSTLTLIDGHRMAAALAAGGADISSIPLDAIGRVEIVTDSASAIYGSDAVAGVVNVILKKDYEGARTSLSYGYAPDGGGAQKRASQLFGAGWTGGNVMLAYEHMQQDAVDAKYRDFTESAQEPNSLLPATKSNSVTVTAKQDVTSSSSVFVDGLYVARDANRYATDLSFSPAPFAYPATLRKLAVAMGAEFNLAHDWKATVSANDAEDKTEQAGVFLTVPVTPSFAERSLGTVRGIEASANGIVGNLPAGPARLAFGLGYRHEGFSAALGVNGGPLNYATSGDRDIRYAFGELSMPLLGRSERTGMDLVDVTVSGRSERYSDFGSTTVPKIGLVYQPTTSLKLRTTWGKAFKAPNLFDINGAPQLILLDLPNPTAPGGSSPALYRAGGNPSLQPETAEAWSIGGDYSSESDARLQVSGTLFDIKYRNRLSSIGSPFAALIDPSYAFYVTPSPSAGYAQSVVNEYPAGAFINETGAPFVPGNVVAVVDTRIVNVATQTVRGADLSANYRVDAGPGNTFLFLNAAYLDLTERDTPQSQLHTLSGLAFYPPKFRARAGVTWKPASWSLTAAVNYLAHESNTQVLPAEGVGSWTTIDASVRYAPSLKGVWEGLSVNLSALNILNRDPPFVSSNIQGLNYDSSNASPLGRMITLQLSKEW